MLSHTKPGANSYSLSHVADDVLLRDLSTIVVRDRATTVEMLAHIAEVEERGLYRPEGYDSMHAYCVGELRMSDDEAYKRIFVARKARHFPAIFPALAEGRLHLTALVMLGPKLTAETADDLLAAAAHKTKREIELLLAHRYPQADVPTFVQPIDTPAAAGQPAPTSDGTPEVQHVPEHAPSTSQVSQESMVPLSPFPKIKPLSPGRCALQVTIAQMTHDKMRYAEALVGHAVPSGDIAELIDRAFDAYIEQLEKHKFAACARSRPGKPNHSENARYIPAEVRREVWRRDGGQCTFVSNKGHRCSARKFLEWDHIEPVARGGASTTDNLRLRCRAHNQYEAERAFGAEFMNRKRQRSRSKTDRERAAQAETRAKAAAEKRAQALAENTAAQARAKELIPWLGQLGASVNVESPSAQIDAG